ncbi:MAG: hypothetical protein RL026_2434 [Pseudomonadota bacterium]|jgi:MFS family permease
MHVNNGAVLSPMAGWLDKSRIIAPPGFNRWVIPPAALAIHLCIGMAYGFSVFWMPLSRAVGIEAPVACPAEQTLVQTLVTTHCDWPVSLLGWTYTLFFVVLGSSAALFGSWVEREGPRKAGLVSAVCWAGGLALGALGVALHQLWLLWLGAGVIGGIGLGLGYISPVSTLVKWFPDRRGLATGMAIMGFGGGAMIGSPLADLLMKKFADANGVGAWQALLVMATVYAVAMIAGALSYRLPAPGWQPAPRQSQPALVSPLVTTRHVHVDRVLGTRQFWLLWGVLCLNVSAGIGVLGMASPLLQEVFGARLAGGTAGVLHMDANETALAATVAAAFTGLLSLFNILGRIVWSSVSDVIGRQRTYTLFFVVGVALYALAPSAAAAGQVAVFVALFCLVMTFYGGGFATIPAYLADLFGTQHVGAIHGRLLTAWSVAGILGPVLVNYLREYQLGRGVSPAAAYSGTLYLLAGLLLLGLACNLLVRPVPADRFMSDQQLAAERERAHELAQADTAAPSAVSSSAGIATPAWVVAVAWTLVGLPLAWGIATTLMKALPLFMA